MLIFPPNKTKIVCTIGPASKNREVMEKMMQNGMNIARINFAHGSFEEHRTIIEDLRKTAKKLNKRIVILGDLPGPKIRVEDIEPIELKEGDRIVLSSNPEGNEIGVNLENFASYLSSGTIIYLNDGFLQLRVESIEGQKVKCICLIGGKLSSHKGINLPGVELPLKAIGDFERKCLDFAKSVKIDAISISFAQSKQDILDAKAYCEKISYNPFIIAKIERLKAIENIDEILQETNGIMVARGDLGVETPIESIAILQKQLIQKANILGKPVITATQMLESMTNNIRPTRAESTDVANAILDGTDCVMLSEESAVGKYPAESVLMLSKIAQSVENKRYLYPIYETLFKVLSSKSPTLEDTMAVNVFTTVKNLNPLLLVTPTTSGATARRMSRFKLPIWILGVTHNENVAQNLEFSYGVYPIYEQELPQDWKSYIKSLIGEHESSFVLVRGPSKKNPDANNSLEIVRIK
ncbi:pyruvate kinase [Desulfurella multipotens]|uniref:pyruvate kinase n=1 Tax=Desulfurella multipotens TaxID=79269 RepID=UPI000CC0E841|nr:pyruvate kinase [Desulfurella multipotens]PMP62668.1 MAG: pyruvate kinase [Desulfurella multipotens]